ncbi:unnamed protein product [Mycena citricolor]|uniref:F-box domain-containing protein n=1 Tax=Mycena citricolor TaxID=2018698 RepID=A0AAD2Q556_9AGAR|nr:unnamed protein product [Mycena citricolor]
MASSSRSSSSLPSSPSAHSLAALAPEIVEEIIAFLPPIPKSYLALSRVSHAFHSLCIRFIYGHIVLRSPSALVQCFRAIVATPNPLAVRSIEVNCRRELSSLASFSALVQHCLVRLTNVTRLVIFAPEQTTSSFVSALQQCSFPWLTHLESCFSLDERMSAFLSRHPRISYLQLDSLEPTSLGGEIRLPGLEYFVGNSTCLAPVARHASLRAAFITWDDADEARDNQDVFAALERRSTDTLNVLACRRHSWNLDLLEQISWHLPHIYALSLTNLFFVPVSRVSAETSPLDAIRRLLTRFSCLQRLAVSCVNVMDADDALPIEPNMDGAFESVTSWGESCPSLLECTLPQSGTMKWIRICDNLWLPDLAHPTGPGSRWIWDRLRERRYPDWDRILETTHARRGGAAAIAHMRLLALRDAALDLRVPSHRMPQEEEQREIRLGGAGSMLEEEDVTETRTT